MSDQQYDVIVVGAGNAAFCAAVSAREHGATVLVIERAPQERRGGNTAFTGGTFRIAYRGADDIKAMVPDLTDEQIASTDFGDYTEEQYLDDFGRLTQYQADPDLIEILVRKSAETVQWIRGQGVRFVVKYGRQAMKHEGRFKFSAGIVIHASGEGRGLVDAQFAIMGKQGIAVRYDSQAVSLLRGRAGVEGVRLISGGIEEEIRARAVVLASGGFSANREWRARYLGAGWDLAKVRGTRYNTGDGIRMALDMGAQPYGQWSGCHATSWERYAPGYGDEMNPKQTGERHCYQFSVMINSEGKRFLDEGADFRNYTYAKYGRIVLQQPGSYAWQVFDAQAVPYLRSDYTLPGVTKVRANTLEELAERMQDVNRAQFLGTVREYNAAIKRDVPLNPNAKDGRCTVGLAIPKSNWAIPIEVPPFEAYAVGTAVTFTWGGLKIDTTARVLDIADAPIGGLYAAGELVGGIFYFNYGGGSGLTAGAVFGRIAGREAGLFARL